ncbi:hypothetical protein SBI_07930 [Streptomyces bingchenggensis BCW-1]|uniref:AG1 protein n=2 Tax=Streptomyces TaxID=1883 RepID=D7CF28_STRBB|nr:hypothetical protein [Streptomyces bingchenggensis]ADI11050.1 hypothetical protein SBI_07930 [Streptomyces bingchenggensis BCW-1]
MSFDSEWSQLKADAAGQQSAHTRLNQLAAAGGGGGGEDGGKASDLIVHQDDLGAVGHEAFVLHGELQKAADIAGAGADKDGWGSSMQSAKALSDHNFTMGEELSTTVSVWTSQVKTMLQMCAHISNHLDYSKKSHANDDELIAASFRNRDGSAVSVSEISKMVK